MLVTIAREEALRNAKTGEIGETDKNGENGKNRDKDENLWTKLEQILCIWYPITFWKQSVLALFDLVNEVNAIYQLLPKN